MKESIGERLRKRTEDKATWPDGPWKSEPDRKAWTDEASGLSCLVLRGPSGSWCGYVGVPSSHPAHGLPYSQYEVPLEKVSDGSATPDSVKIQKAVNDLQVHGGLTYSGSDELRSPPLHWFGFDCSHAGDWSPKYDDVSDLGRETGWGATEEYRTLDYVMAECASLAKQLASIKD